jgi:aminoglycoside 6'-N-acetyltransferase
MRVIAEREELVIRRMRDETKDYRRMAEWQNRSHVREWWDPDEPDLTEEGAAAVYGPMTRDDSQTTPCIIELEGRPIGYVQFYPWDDDEEGSDAMGLPPSEGAWGLDVFIGEPDLVNRGIGTAAVSLLCDHLFDERDASSVRLVSAIDNERALRSYEKAGFRKANRVLDTDTRGGQRVESWLMIREATTGS